MAQRDDMAGDAAAPEPLSFEAEVIYWRGPSPFFYAPAPPHIADEIRRAAKFVTYGWGMIPVVARIGGVAFETSLFPKDATYLLPLKAAVRRKTEVTAGDTVSIEMTIQPRGAAARVPRSLP